MSGPTGFLGLSHLGIISSIGWASFGAPVIAVDTDEKAVATLRGGAPPVHEPSLDELLARSRTHIEFSADLRRLSACPLVIVARDVPTNDRGESDPSAVLDLIDAAIPHLSPGTTLALMSQVTPGFTRALGERLRASRPDLGVKLYYWVETLIFGRAVERFLRPERLIVGCADPAAPLAPELASGLLRFGCPILPMRYESAELTKTAINLYLCAAVTYANTMSDLCEAVGADWGEVVPALRLDARIGPSSYIKPGLGIAGGNLERDMVTLQDLGSARAVDTALIDTMLVYNARRWRWVLRKVEERVFAKGGRPVLAVWGLAYKKDTHSTKNSMSLRVIGELHQRAEIRAYDPVVRIEVEGARIVRSREEALAGADALLVLTDWGEFAAPDPKELASMRRTLLIDAVGVVDRSRLAAGQTELVTMGRGT
jgi:UDPglucose 6-dehydrogenase